MTFLVVAGIGLSLILIVGVAVILRLLKLEKEQKALLFASKQTAEAMTNLAIAVLDLQKKRKIDQDALQEFQASMLEYILAVDDFMARLTKNQTDLGSLSNYLDFDKDDLN